MSLTDGAKWIWRAVITWLVCLSAVLLDFYHLAQHVHEAARCCLGETEAASVWAAEQLSQAKAGGAKTLTLRLKRPGMKWDRDHAADLMNLISLRESGQWKAYWSQRAAA